jgi:hypothetical protein
MLNWQNVEIPSGGKPFLKAGVSINLDFMECSAIAWQ